MKKIKSYNEFSNLNPEKQSEEWMKACEEISMLTGLRLEDVVRNSYGLVVKQGHELFGKIGIYDFRVGEHNKAYFKFKGKRKSIEFNLDENKIFWARNVVVILEERENLYKLFPD